MRLLASSLLSLSLLACSDGTSPPPPGTQPDATPILVDAPPPTSGAVLDLVPSDHAFIRTLDAGRQLWQLDDGVYWQDELRATGTVLRGQLDGDLAIATQRYNTQTATPPTYCRFDTRTGELDQTFGAYGCAEAPRSYFTTTGIVKGGDGYLALVQRQCTNGCPDVERSFGLVRFSAAGVVDLTFGTEGIQFSTVLADLDAEYFAAQSTGKLVVSGYTGLYAMKLFRIDATGELDTTFGTDGFIPMANGGQVRVLADDSILMEATYNGTERIDRYTANGQVLWKADLETITQSVFDNDFHQLGADLDATGRVVVAYRRRDVEDGPYRYGFLRLTPDGLPDPTFRVTLDGIAITELSGVGIEPDGRIIFGARVEGRPHIGHLQP